VTRHVIIGNGPAGVVAAETLRRADAAAEITLIGDEAEPPYSRMAIPYLLMGTDRRGGHLSAQGCRSFRAFAHPYAAWPGRGHR
jgi:NADPH-dependent 2,4-dienoyl-CoA reductase/sulfur reductase-like enzyme